MSGQAVPVEVQEGFSKVLEDIRPGVGSSPEKLSLACAALTMLAARPNSHIFPLQDSISALRQLLDDEHTLVQANSFAAMTAVCEASDPAWRVASSSDVAAKTVDMLRHSLDDSLILNMLTILGALAEPGDPGLRAVIRAGGIEACQRYATEGQQPPVQEAALDAICRMAAVPASRPFLSEKGVAETLGLVLGQAGASMDIKVRALMALAMLLGGSQTNQKKVASMPAAVAGLAVLMRQNDDEDARQVSSTIFAELVKAPETKHIMIESMQITQESAAKR
ncbi:hypothetical protein WJX74_004746 [Apatococcus lobatus]|uniref:Uncharacterized protein n=1 Tax=Apatococcus lobatus TaxID=904363 RepID=A0AAW1RTF4_9CHLO